MYSLVERHNRFRKSDVRKMACGGLRLKQKIILQLLKSNVDVSHIYINIHTTA